MAKTLAQHPRHVALAALVAGVLLCGAGAAVVTACCCATVALSALSRRPAFVLATAALFLAGAWAGSERRQAIDRAPMEAWIGRTVDLKGYVVRHERPTRTAHRLRLRTTHVREAGPGAAARPLDDLVQIRLRRSAHLPALAIGDEITATGTLERPVNGPDAGFDYVAYLRRAGVHGVLRAGRVMETGKRRSGTAGLVDGIRVRAEHGVGEGLDPIPAALAEGMVLGQDERVPREVVDQFKASGLAHLLAVSGQNITLLALLAWPLLGALGLGRRARLAGVLGLIALYVPLTGAGPSIMRAGAMGAAATIAALAGRPASRWYALLLSAAFTLLVDPRAWLDPGWQLSFAAVIGIFCLTPGLTRLLARLPRPLALGAAVTVAATVATAPLMAFHFGRLPLVSLPANLLALPVVAPIMWLGMLAAAAGQVSTEAAALLNGLNGYCLAYLAEVARWSAGWPGAAWPARIGSPLGLAAVYGALALAVTAAAALWRRGRERPGGATAPALAGALLLIVATGAWLFPAGAPRAPDHYTVTFLDVGQGDAILLQPPGAAVLVDGGPPEADVVAALREHGVRTLDVVVLTHPQRDHQEGLEAVLRALPVKVLLDGGGDSPDPVHRRIVALARKAGTRVLAARSGQVLEVAGLRMRVLSPERPFEVDGAEPNDQAVVLLASYRGFDALLPADVESNVTLGLRLRGVEVLKVAHHGSEDEGLPALLDRLRPRIAVIEVGAHNRYGHPTPETLAALTAAGPGLWRTDRDGDVSVSAGARGPAVQTER